MCYTADKQYLTEIVQRIVNERKANPEHSEEILLDALIDFTDDEEMQFSESVVYGFIGSHVTGTCECLSFYITCITKKYHDFYQT